MDATLFHSIWTVAMLVLFIGIVAWAWSGKRKARFEAAARLPLDDDELAPTNTLTTPRGENKHG